MTLTELLLSPAERADILIDFSMLNPGTKVIFTNDAKAPYPNGAAPDPNTVGQIMQFAVLDTPIVSPAQLPAELNKIPVLTPNVPKEILTLNIIGQASTLPTELLLDGQMWEAPTSELPIVGSTVEWEFVNFTNRIKLRFAPQDANPKKVKPGVNLFPFDPTFGPGYVWHCHIIDHEDNEMMRPLKVTSCPCTKKCNCCVINVFGKSRVRFELWCGKSRVRLFYI